MILTSACLAAEEVTQYWNLNRLPGRHIKGDDVAMLKEVLQRSSQREWLQLSQILWPRAISWRPVRSCLLQFVYVMIVSAVF